MDRHISPLVPFFVSVAIAGALIGLLLGNADPAVQLVAMVASVLLAHICFAESSLD